MKAFKVNVIEQATKALDPVTFEKQKAKLKERGVSYLHRH